MADKHTTEKLLEGDILSGEGLYQDNDKTYPVEAGMTTFCEDGNGHAISCKGDEPLVFLAMIQKKEAR